jgi:hypothetical protein
MSEPAGACFEDALPALAPRVAARCAPADAGALAATCRAARGAFEARLTRLTVAASGFDKYRSPRGSPGLRSAAALRALGAGRFPAARRVEVFWGRGEGEAEVAAALAAAPAAAGSGGSGSGGGGGLQHWAGVTELQLGAMGGRLSPVLALLVARCPGLRSLEAAGNGSPASGKGPGRQGLFAALEPAAATLLEAKLDGVGDLAAADVRRHLGALTRLTRLELGARLLGTETWAAAAAALPALTALESLNLGLQGGATGPPPLPLAPLSRLRELSLFPSDGKHALAAALADARRRGRAGAGRAAPAALAALTRLSLLHEPNIEMWGCAGVGGRGPRQRPRAPRLWRPPLPAARVRPARHSPSSSPSLVRPPAPRRFGEGPAPLDATALRDLRAAAPNLAALELSRGVEAGLFAREAALPQGITRLALGFSAPHCSVARLAPRVRELTVWEATMMDAAAVRALFVSAKELEAVTLKGYTFGTYCWEDLEESLEEPDLSCLGGLPALRRLRLLDGWLLSGPCPGREAPGRLAAWAAAWSRAPLEELELVAGHGGNPHTVRLRGGRGRWRHQCRPVAAVRSLGSQQRACSPNPQPHPPLHPPRP